MVEVPYPQTALRRWWPMVTQTAVVAVFALVFTGALAGYARLDFAPTLKLTAYAGVAALALLTIVDETLKRFRLIPKTDDSTTFEDPEQPSVRPEPAPIVRAVDVECDPLVTETPASADENESSLTPLAGGALPAAFSPRGAKATWLVSRGHGQV